MKTQKRANAVQKHAGSPAMHHTGRTIATALLLFAIITISAGAQDLSSAFNEANRLYEQQRYSDAAAAYDGLIKGGHVSSALFFNLGNAWFKAGQTGRAIAAYREAKKIAPRDPDVRANLQFARGQVQNSKEPKANLWTALLDRLTLNEWTVLSSSVFTICFLLLALGQWKLDWAKPLRGYVISLALLACALILCTGFAAERRFTQGAVVVTQEAVARRGPFDESQSAFTLRDGAELTVSARKDKWLQVIDTSNRIGWVAEAQVEVLSR